MSTDVLNWAVQTGWAVSLIILVILIVRRPFTRLFGARLTYALWALPVLRLVMPTIVLPARAVAPSMPMNSGDPWVVEAAISGNIAQTGPLAPAMNWTGLVLFVWLGGALVFLIWQILRQRRFHALITRNVRQLPDALKQEAQEIAQQLGLRTLPKMSLSRDRFGPLVLGVFQPMIVLPVEFDRAYTSRQRRFVIGHELMHIRRRDLLSTFAVLLFRALNWPNPIVHFAAVRFLADQEAACDASLLSIVGDDGNQRHDYAQTLLNAARRSVRLTYSCPLGLTIYHPLKERLMILQTQEKPSGVLSRTLAGSLIAALVIASAPFTRAQDSGENMAGADVSVDSTEKKVIKMIKNIDGVEVKKHYEIITENGETKAYEIDEIGNRTEVDADSLDMVKMDGGHTLHFKQGTADGDDVNIEFFADGDGENVTRKKIIMRPVEGIGLNQEELKAFLEKHGSEANVLVFSADHEQTVGTDGKTFSLSSVGRDHNARLVGVAKRMTEKAERSEDLNRHQRRKLEKAIKALEEAEAALAEE